MNEWEQEVPGLRWETPVNTLILNFGLMASPCCWPITPPCSLLAPRGPCSGPLLWWLLYSDIKEQGSFWKCGQLISKSCWIPKWGQKVSKSNLLLKNILNIFLKGLHHWKSFSPMSFPGNLLLHLLGASSHTSRALLLSFLNLDHHLASALRVP